MPTHDYVIDNQTAPNFRADLNQALQAIVSNNSSTSAPSTTYANMIWYDTTNNILYMRTEADDGWIALGTLNQVASTFAANVAIASQAEAQAGAENTKTLTALRVAQATLSFFNVSGAAPLYACRAWVNFDGASGTIRASGNVSSVTKNATGDYTVNFAVAMPDTSYSAQFSASRGDNNRRLAVFDAFSTTSVRVFTGLGNAVGLGAEDPNQVVCAIFR
jgi:hypothetical protein